MVTVWPEEKPRFAGAFLRVLTSRFQYAARHSSHLCNFAHSAAAPACYAGRMSQEKLALFSILLGFALIAVAALVLVIFLP
jgi:hypothetical protein